MSGKLRPKPSLADHHHHQNHYQYIDQNNENYDSLHQAYNNQVQHQQQQQMMMKMMSGAAAAGMMSTATTTTTTTGGLAVKRHSSSATQLAVVNTNSMKTHEVNSNMTTSDNEKAIVYMGDGWCTFPDLDNFDSDKLLRALTLQESDSGESIWNPSVEHSMMQLQLKASLKKNINNNNNNGDASSVSLSAQRQLEALFNLTQLLFGLSRAETVNFTFRDLQFKKHPHSFKRSGFKKLKTDGRVDFYAVFEELVRDIVEQGGLEVAFMMYLNPRLPMVRQKVLDLITNVATVPDIAYKIMMSQNWFLDHLLRMIRDGQIVSDKIPALSVLIRLLKVMLTERMKSAYLKLVDMQYIDCLVDIFETPAFTLNADYIQFFIKFESIAMQSLTVILGDREYIHIWSETARTRLINYCMIILLKAINSFKESSGNGVNNGGTGTANGGANDLGAMSLSSSSSISTVGGGGGGGSTSASGRYGRNHILYAEETGCNHSLAFAIITVNELLRSDSKMRMFYRHHQHFKWLIIRLYKKYGAKSKTKYSYTYPGISYALNHLMRVLYLRLQLQQQQQLKQISIGKKSGNSDQSKEGSSTTAAVAPAIMTSATRHAPWPSSSSEQTTLLANNEQQQMGRSNNNNNSMDKTVRVCSNPECQNEETKFKKFKDCSKCFGRQAAYCSGRCRKQHLAYHLEHECNGTGAGGGGGGGDEEGEGEEASAGSGNGQMTVLFRSASGQSHVTFQPRSPSFLSLANINNSGNNNNNNNNSSNQRRVSDVLDLVVQTGDTVHQSLSRTKRLSKYSSMNDHNNRRNSLNLVKPTMSSYASASAGTTSNSNNDSEHDQFDFQAKSSLPNVIDGRPPAPLRYAKHANSMKDIKPNKQLMGGMTGGYLTTDTGESIRNKLMTNVSSSRTSTALAAPAANGVDSSMNFTRPLKTSTAVCLTDLRSRTNDATSKQSRFNMPSESGTKKSSNFQIPPHRQHNYRQQSSDRREDMDDEAEHESKNTSRPKRRHSTTASIQKMMTKTTTTTQVTTKMTKIKRATNVVEFSTSSSSDENEFEMRNGGENGGQETANEQQQHHHHRHHRFARTQRHGSSRFKEFFYDKDEMRTNSAVHTEQEDDYIDINDNDNGDEEDDDDDDDEDVQSLLSEFLGEEEIIPTQKVNKNTAENAMKKSSNKKDDMSNGKTTADAKENSKEERRDVEEEEAGVEAGDEEEEEEEEDVESERMATTLNNLATRQSQVNSVNSLSESPQEIRRKKDETKYSENNASELQNNYKLVNNDMERSTPTNNKQQQQQQQRGATATTTTDADRDHSSELESMLSKQRPPDASSTSRSQLLQQFQNNSKMASAPINLTIESLCYDNTVVGDNHDDEDDDEEPEDDHDEDEDDDVQSNGKANVNGAARPNFVINNSIDSQQQVIINRSDVGGGVAPGRGPLHRGDDTSGFFHTDTTSNAENNKVTVDGQGVFKIPEVPPLRPLNPPNNTTRKVKIYDELKVFSNLSNIADNSTIHPSELPKNSTPILADAGAQAILNARRKQLLNAKLDLTITPSGQLLQNQNPNGVLNNQNLQMNFQSQPLNQQQNAGFANNPNNLMNANNLQNTNKPPQMPQPSPPTTNSKPLASSETRKSGKFSIPKFPSFRSKQSQPKQAQETASNNAEKNRKSGSTNSPASTSTSQGLPVIELVGGGKRPTPTTTPTNPMAALGPGMSNILEISKYSACENVVATNNIVSVPKTNIPKEVKKRIIDDLKSDKPTRCVIQ